jgi:hypothetical protein
MIKRQLIIFAVFIALLPSCNPDFFNAEPEVFLGKIYLKPYSGDKSKKMLSYIESYTKGDAYFSTPLVSMPISQADGNDSSIYVRSSYMDSSYFTKIRHLKGQSIIQVSEIDSLNYTTALQKTKFEYHYILHK